MKLGSLNLSKIIFKHQSLDHISDQFQEVAQPDRGVIAFFYSSTACKAYGSHPSPHHDHHIQKLPKCESNKSQTDASSICWKLCPYCYNYAVEY